MPKIWKFDIENCDISEVFENKQKKYPRILRECMIVCMGSRLEGHQCQSSAKFSVKLSVFENFTCATVFNIKSPNFRHLLTFTCSLHFWNIQSANFRFSINSRSVYCRKWHLGDTVYRILTVPRGVCPHDPLASSSSIILHFAIFHNFSLLISDIFRRLTKQLQK